MANPRFTQSDEEELIGRALAALGPAFTNWLAQQQGGIEQLVGAGAPSISPQVMAPVPQPQQGAASPSPQMSVPQNGDRVMDVLARYGLI